MTIDKDPTSWSIATWLLATCMAIGGGLLNWSAQRGKGDARAFNLIELIGEICVSGFIGLAAFMAAAGLGQPEGLCSVAAGIGGHMGTRLVFALERAIENRLDREGTGGPPA